MVGNAVGDWVGLHCRKEESKCLFLIDTLLQHSLQLEA